MQLTMEEAYKSMFLYLEAYYERTNSDDVGALLGGMMILDDGKTMDPAAWNDWIDCVYKVKNK